jgi:hypothetical protein
MPLTPRRTTTNLIRFRPDQLAGIGAVAPDGGAMIRSMSLDGLMRKWRARADELRPYTAPTAAAFERAAAELEEALAAYLMEPLTLAQAEAESGYSSDHLGRKVRDGAIPNAGRPRAPRILRRDLPRKATSLRTTEPPPTLVGATPRQIARAVVDS